MEAVTSTDVLAIPPLEERESIEQRVARTLRELIVAGQLRAGTPLVQRELAQRLGVSPTPVRASLLQLEREGFVAIGSTGRAVVSLLTGEDFEEIERLFRRSERYNRLVLSTPERFRESVGRYREFLSACEASDGAGAERVIHDSLRWAVDRVAGNLPSELEVEPEERI